MPFCLQTASDLASVRVYMRARGVKSDYYDAEVENMGDDYECCLHD